MVHHERAENDESSFNTSMDFCHAKTSNGWPTLGGVPHVGLITNGSNTFLDIIIFFFSVIKIGEFNWDGQTQGLILGSFFWGYMITPLPGGILARKFGGKNVFGLGVLLSALFSLLTPVAARLNVAALIVVRVLIGLAEVGYPYFTSLLKVN